MDRVISRTSEWTFDLVERYDREIARCAADYRLDTYANQLEVISAEQMMDAYASAGMPIGYGHWSFGKHFLGVENHYRRGRMGLAYEIVINSDPCIAYLMEENTLPMQALVIAHASYGHNSFFKGNYLFRTWTNADAIIDYLVFARDYIRDCEQRHGEEAVELLLDSCHALQNHGIDSYRRPPALSATEERTRSEERQAYEQLRLNELWSTVPRAETEDEDEPERFPSEPQENLLYFIEKNAPLLEPWQREIVRIVRKLAQYFYPQRYTKVMNEGWACFWHYTLLNTLYDEGYLDDGFMIEFLQSHTNVIYQPSFDDPHYAGINPYALGFSMMSDIRRICDSPTDEDHHWFPEIAGAPWREVLESAMRDFKDDSFVTQYLSPHLMREMRLFDVLDDDERDMLEIRAIHDDQGYRQLRRALAAQFSTTGTTPDIQVVSVDRRGDRSLTLRHTRHDRRPLGDTTDTVLEHVARLWGFDVRLEVADDGGRAVGLHEVRAPR